MAKYRLEKISDILSWFTPPFKLQPLPVNIPFKKKKKEISESTDLLTWMLVQFFDF